MAEQHPDDLTLLTAEHDATTGAPYIPTGTSPYVLAFRQLIHRMLRISERANDLRPYAEVGLFFGVRPGRCRIAGTGLTFDGAESQALAPTATTWVWLDADGTLHTSTSALPDDPTRFIPIAQITTDSGAVTSLIDLRGECFLQAPDPQMLGLEATVDEINQALDGVHATVTAQALNVLTAGAAIAADSLHQHQVMSQQVDGIARLRLFNESAHADANISLMLGLPSAMNVAPELTINRDNGFFQQTSDNVAYDLVGVLPVQRSWPQISASSMGETLGCVPIDGEVVAVSLSVGSNIVSDDAADGLRADVLINGAALTTTSPAITADAGGGFRATDQGEGTSAILNAAHTTVHRGDMLTVDLVRTANGVVTSEAGHVAVLVIVKAAGPQ